jgi:preprotein translocase subunit SecB
MSTSSVESQFQFISYKIDKIEMRMTNKINFLLNNNPVLSDNIKLGIRIGNPMKYSINSVPHYIGSISVNVDIQDPASHENILTGEFGITGIFTTTTSIDKEVEERMVKINIPALLMPYLRSTMTNVLSNAGFGTVLLPLVNMYELAQRSNIEIIDHTNN